MSDAVGPALIRQSLMWGNPLINAFPDQLRVAAIEVLFTFIMPLRWSVFVVYDVVRCKQACLHDNLRRGNKASFVFFSALHCFFKYFCFILIIFSPPFNFN